MAAIIFNGADGRDNRGRVVFLKQDFGAAGTLLDVAGWAGYPAIKAIFTKVSIGEQTNHQFQHELGDWIYLYVFGDRIGQCRLSGLAFYDVCDANQPQTGLSQVLKYYRENRLSRREKPIKITLDPTLVLECYLQSVALDTVDASQLLYQFQFDLAVIPPNDLRQKDRKLPKPAARERDEQEEAAEQDENVVVGGDRTIQLGVVPTTTPTAPPLTAYLLQ